MSVRTTSSRIIACISTVLAALAVAGIASASPDDYLYDLNHAGIGGTKDQLLALGHGSCADAHQNVPRADSVARIKSNTNLTSGDAAFLYDSALQFLCG